MELAFYDKEEIKNFALENDLVSKDTKEDELYNFYLSLDAEKDSIIKQSETVRKIALKENCIIVGRGADYILKESPHLIRIFLYAPQEYRINKIKEMYAVNIIYRTDRCYKKIVLFQKLQNKRGIFNERVY